MRQQVCGLEEEVERECERGRSLEEELNAMRKKQLTMVASNEQVSEWVGSCTGCVSLTTTVQVWVGGTVSTPVSVCGWVGEWVGQWVSEWVSKWVSEWERECVWVCVRMSIPISLTWSISLHCSSIILSSNPLLSDWRWHTDRASNCTQVTKVDTDTENTTQRKTNKATKRKCYHN